MDITTQTYTEFGFPAYNPITVNVYSGALRHSGYFYSDELGENAQNRLQSEWERELFAIGTVDGIDLHIFVGLNPYSCVAPNIAEQSEAEQWFAKASDEALNRAVRVCGFAP